ncbi:uncharacterized protein LOC135477172 [Liolophura sinensis]|uniref:uncharacterized protein LOC135477172 n=1 Tax=Liolophura sinensis TaxID=3198878 RepID=UPI0031580C39
MSIRRILVEKSVLFLGKWDFNRINDDIVRLIDLDSRDKKGKKVRLQLTTEGLQVARGIFQDSQSNDFIPIRHILNMIVGTYSQQNVICFTRGHTKAYTVLVYNCANDYDSAEFVDNYRRMRRSITVEGDSFDLRPIDDGNWTLIRTNNSQASGTLYVQKNRRIPTGQTKVIVGPPIAHEYGTLMSARHAESHNKVVVQNGNSTTHSDSGIVTNGTGTTSSERPRTKAKRAKSFKLFDSLKGGSKREQSPRRERKVKQEKYEKHEKREKQEKHENYDKKPIIVVTNYENEINSMNGVEPMPISTGQNLYSAELGKNLQEMNEKLRSIELMLEKGGSKNEQENSGSANHGEHYSSEDKTYASQGQSSQAASDTDVRPSPRVRLSSAERNSSNNVRIHTQRNGEVKVMKPEYRIPVGYDAQRPIRISHERPGHQHQSHRVRAHSSGSDGKRASHHGVEIRLGPSQNMSSSMTLPRSSGTKHVPRVTFDETATEGNSRKNSTRSAGWYGNHGPRAADTVVKPIEKVYANPNAYYGQARTVVIGPGVRQTPVRHSVHDRDFNVDDRRTGVPENGY